MDGIKGNATQEIHRAMPMVMKKSHARMEEIVMDKTGPIDTNRTKQRVSYLCENTNCKPKTLHDSNRDIA